MYAHQDPNVGTKAAITRPLWRNALIPVEARVRSDYRNGSSLELARLAVMRYAYHHDPTNYKFVLVSESCVPLLPLIEMHTLLTKDGRPRIHEIPDNLNPGLHRDKGVGSSPQDKSRGKRWVSSLAPLIPMEKRMRMLQHRQFVVASREEVRNYPPASDVSRLFGMMSRAEEHAFYNILVHQLGYRRGVDIEVACVTYQRFTPKRDSYRPPLSCKMTARGLELEREADILRAKKLGCLFVRKIAPTCDLSCFVQSGFERFQCSA